MTKSFKTCISRSEIYYITQGSYYPAFSLSCVFNGAFSAGCSPQIAPPALCNSKTSSGLPPWSVASLALWWPEWSEELWFVLGQGLLPELQSCWPWWLQVFQRFCLGAALEACCPPQGFWAPPLLLTRICYISLCLLTVLLPKAASLPWSCADKEHAW